jgi:3-oxoacyl-[acyl-carrier protein] reductase
MQQILSDHKRIDILVNNAGYPFDSNIWYKKFHEGKDEEIDRIIEVDLKGSVRLSRAVIPVMLQNTSTISGHETGNGNGNEGGVIINISSTPAISGYTEGSPTLLPKLQT